MWPAHLSSRTSYQLTPLAGHFHDIVIVRILDGRLFGDQPADEPLKDHAESWKYDVTATLHGNEGETVLQIDPLHDMSWHRKGVGGDAAGKNLDRAAVLDWLKAAAVTATDSQSSQWIEYEVQELLGIFIQLHIGVEDGKSFDDLSDDEVGKAVADWAGMPMSKGDAEARSPHLTGRSCLPLLPPRLVRRRRWCTPS